MRTKVVFAAVVLAAAPLGAAGKDALYPNEKVTEFVIEKLDVTSLPSAFRPKKERTRKTFADYGFTSQKVDQNDAVIEAGGGVKRLTIEVLAQTSNGIYMCFAEPGQNGGDAKTQSVVLLKRKDPNALLQGRESFREFAACPVIGGTGLEADSYGGD